MITEQQKLEIGRLIVLEKADLGSWAKAATRLAVNEVTIRYNMLDRDKWHNVSDKMWVKVAGKLGYTLNETTWHLVETTNTRVMGELLYRAQNEQLFMAISFEAGQGKSAGAAMYRMDYEAVFYIECEESWSHKQFVVKLAETLGCLKATRTNVSALTDEIVDFLKQKAARTRPLLVVDEANKLKPSSLRLFIPLFNKLQDEIGMVLIGAHDLKKRIQSGVRWDARGMDELESRLGRSYMPLVGIFEADVRAICEANGLADYAAQTKVWQRMQPERVAINGNYEWVSKRDLRVLKAAVKHERLALVDQVQGANRLRIPKPTEMESAMGAKVEPVMEMA